MYKLIFQVALSATLSLSTFSSPEDNCQVIRGVFDIGSGSTKMKVFKWDECQDKLLKEFKECADHKKVAYKEDLKNSQELKESTIEFGIKKLKELKKKAISCGATQF